MSFNSYGGIFFSIFVLVVYRLIPTHRLQNVFLLVCSIYFYATSSLVFTTLLLGTICVGYYGGLLIENAQHRGVSTRLHLIVAITILLLTLGVFKYYDFFVSSFAQSLSLFGFNTTLSTLNIVLPVGISFYVFQTIGYLVDVNRKEVKAETNLVDFGLFVSFFPQLVAGPIERSRNLLQQVKLIRPIVNRSDITYGFFLIGQGYVKKVVIADNLAVYVDALFIHDNLSAPLIWVGLLMFAIQIYGDFSGYTDIARGYCRLLGFKILLNFDRPYAARSPSDFWRRWHISLSRWFTDYVYFGLGGNRSKSKLRQSSNVMATMTLSGLWHGASANFILWGMYHGLIILGTRVVKTVPLNRFKEARIVKVFTVMLTFVLMLYGWMYFRITNFEQLIAFNNAIFTKWEGWAPAYAFLLQGALFILLWLLIDIFETFWLNVHEQSVKHFYGIWVYIGMMLFLILSLHAKDSNAFIYFQF